uniref:Uncharacterized protein n=1 Tax=Physcomitrium patens TaxID=3218 RepID=A0A2K1JR13_PHYPA|nr:hypothetical protein PHYPA_016353 [Physcomitrium patens]
MDRRTATFRSREHKTFHVTLLLIPTGYLPGLCDVKEGLLLLLFCFVLFLFFSAISNLILNTVHHIVLLSTTLVCSCSDPMCSNGKHWSWWFVDRVSNSCDLSSKF